MRNNEIRVVMVLVTAVSLSLSACTRSDRAAPARAVTGAIVRPASQTTQASPPAQAAPLPSSNAVLTPPASAPDATSRTRVPANVSAADSTESFTIAGRTFRMLKHVQRSAHDETVEWWELRNSKDQVYRETYPVSMVNGAFDFMVFVTATSFTTKEGAGIV